MPFDNLPIGIEESSEDDILLALGTPKGEDDKTKDSKKTDEKGKEKSATSKDKSSAKIKLDTDVQELSDDEREIALGKEDEDDEDDDKGEDKDKKKVAKKVSKDKAPDSGDDDDKGDGKTDEDDDDDKGGEGELTVPVFLKARVANLVKTGAWGEWDGWEDIEWDEETFEEVEAQQDALREAEIEERVLDSFGPLGREIAKYSQNGGDPEKLIELFKDQKKVENLSVESEDGQKNVVFKYQTEFLKRSPEAANRYIKSLIADKELEVEAKDAKDSMEKSLKEERENLTKQQEQFRKDRENKIKENISKFSNEMTTLISARQDIPADEKKELVSVLTKYNKKLTDGTPVNDFYFKMQEFRKNPENYLEMVRLVLNPAKYKKSLEIKGGNDATDKHFKLVRTSQSKNKAKPAGSSSDEVKKKTTGFKLF